MVVGALRTMINAQQAEAKDVSDWTVRYYVLDVMADDYENFEHVVASVNRWMLEDGKSVTLAEIIEGLKEVIRAGEAKAYELFHRKENWCIEVPFTPERVWELWYYVTPKGLELVKGRES